MRRLKLAGADWHVTCRGARRLQLFHDDADFRTFYALLGESTAATGARLFADCLMSNHFHLGLSCGSEELTHCMQRLNRAFSGYHNDRYDLSGHAFEQAYFCEPIPSDFILRRVVRYIHLNPVRAGKSATPEEYPWSSYRRLANADPESLGSEERRILGLFDPDLRTARSSYREFVSKDLIRPIVIPVGRTPAWEIWQEQFRWILEFLFERDGDLSPLSVEAVAVHLGSRAGIPPRAMGAVLRHPNGRKVSEIIRRVARQLQRDLLLKARIDRLGVL